MKTRNGCENSAFELGDEISHGSADSDADNANKAVNDTALLYAVDDSPAWYACVVLALQHCLVSFGALIGLPLIVAPSLCVADDESGDVARALIISTLFFTSGICTLLQTTLGVRLPIVQGGTFTFLPPTLAIMALPQNQCPDPLPPGFQNSTETLYNDTDGTIVNGDELWMRRMRQVQGAIAVASALQLLLGLTGAIGFLLRFIGPLTIAPAIGLIGLDLFSSAYDRASVQWGIAMFTSFVMILCSQYLKTIDVPIPVFSRAKKCHLTKIALFRMFPVLFALISAWILCLIFTETNVFPTDPNHPNYGARTDVRSSVISNAPWFRFPYPGQWGLPRVTVAGVFGMLAGVVAGVIESVGDYYACARLSGAPNPPSHAVNRGILMEGFGCVLAGVMGTGTATTSFSENIGAIGITRIGSRKVIQIAGILFVILGMLSKIGSVFVAIPDPVIGGIFCVMFGMITATGISSLQHVDLNTARNLFIVGFSFFMGLTVPQWMKANPGVINTGVTEVDQILTVLLQTAMLVGGLLAFVFDNTIPGTEKERGILTWRKAQIGMVAEEERALKSRISECYDLPIRTNCCRFSTYMPFLPEYGEKERNEEREIVVSYL